MDFTPSTCFDWSPPVSCVVNCGEDRWRICFERRDLRKSASGITSQCQQMWVVLQWLRAVAICLTRNRFEINLSGDTIHLDRSEGGVLVSIVFLVDSGRFY